MDNYALSFWINMAVISMFVGGTLKKFLPTHVSAMPSLMAWLGATLLMERLCAVCMPAALALVVLCATCWLYSIWAVAPPVLPVEGKAVFITGCDTGFGNATAKRLDAMGFQVFATVLNMESDGAKHLRSSCSSRLTLLQLDITQPQQVQQALLNTKAKLGRKGLWALVNNAGICINLGDAELSLMSNFRGCMEVNFFGTLSVTQAFLPLLRQNKGRILTISSPSGEQPFPCLASYGASKAALSLFTNTLRHEMEPWGVKVSIILPSGFKTGQSSDTEYWEKQCQYLLQNLSPSLLEDYGEDYVKETKELFQRYAQNTSEDVSPVVNTIVEALLSPQLRPRYYAGPGLALMYFIYSYFPSSLSDKYLRRLFLKKKVMPRALRKGNEPSLISKNNNDIVSNDNVATKTE